MNTPPHYITETYKVTLLTIYKYRDNLYIFKEISFINSFPRDPRLKLDIKIKKIDKSSSD